DRVRVFCDGQTVADHERVWAWHQTITDAEHRQAANMLRRNRIGALRPVRESEAQISVEQRTLSDYDAALGIDLGEDGFAS
ncbi:Mu transposase domain-containing protein, partial [Mycobacterium sherrisii]